MKDQLDQLERKVKQDLDEEFTNLEQEISGENTAANKLLTTTNEMKSYLENNQEGKHKFIAEKIGRNVVMESKALLEKVNSSKHRRITFERNKRLLDDIKIADSIGKIVRSSTTQHRTKRSNYVVKSSNQHNVKVDTDRKSVLVTGMCQLKDTKILMADFYNKKVKVLDEDLNMKVFCNLVSEPYGICSISSTKLVVRYSDAMQFIIVGQQRPTGKTIKMNKLNLYYCNNIAFCGGNLWTFSANSLCIYSTAGALVKTVDKDFNGQKIFPQYHPSSIAVSDDETKVYVTADDRVVVFNNNGDVIMELYDQRLNASRCICITDDDIVLVAGYWSKNVVMFDRDGNSLGELVSSEDMLSRPWSLCYDIQKCRLIVGFTGNEIQIYELSE